MVRYAAKVYVVIEADSEQDAFHKAIDLCSTMIANNDYEKCHKFVVDKGVLDSLTELGECVPKEVGSHDLRFRING